MSAEGVRLFLSIRVTLWSGSVRVSAVTRIAAGKFGEPGRCTGRRRTAKPDDASNATGLERGRRNVACEPQRNCRTQRLYRRPQSCRKSRRAPCRRSDQPIAQPASRKTVRSSQATTIMRCPKQPRRLPALQRWAITKTKLQKNPVVFGRAATCGFL